MDITNSPYDNANYPWKLTTPLSLDVDLLRSPNLCPRIPEDELKSLGHMVIEDFERDLRTRDEWKQRMDMAMKLAMQTDEIKTFPWEHAANVKFPLITIASLQFQSRAYPALINGARPVAARPLASMPYIEMPPPAQPGPNGQPDPRAQLAQQQAAQQAQMVKRQYDALCRRADDIAAHMSYQILEEDEHWEEYQDRLMLLLPIMGCVFKKNYFDPVLCHNVSECVSPRDLVVDYYAKDLDSAPRASHVIYLSSNACYERQVRGVFEEFDDGSPAPVPHLIYELDPYGDDRTGVHNQPSDHDAPYELVEQHRTLDLDGDGYGEPYVITVRYDTKQVLRIVPRFTRKDVAFAHDKRVIRINPIQAFTKYDFIPSPDGGFYGLGFGALLGPINETINSSINQLLDAATLANAGGGFLGRGFKNKKGEYRFRPGEWKTVDSTGDDLRKNILPLPSPQPSTVMFQLLSLLIEYGESIAGAVDIMQGKNPGQNTPAETSRAMVEQGMKVFNGIYKRVHRSFTQELRHLFRLNCTFLSNDMPYYAQAASEITKAAAKLYANAEVVIAAAADPFYMSDGQRYNQAVALLSAAQGAPQLYDLYEAHKYYVEALKVPNIDRFLPNPAGPFARPPLPNPKLQIEQLKSQDRQLKEQLAFKVKLLDLVQKAELQAAQIKLLEAQVVQTMAEAKGVDVGHQIALIEAQIGAAKNKQEGTLEAIKLLHEVTGGNQSGGGDDESSNGGSGGLGAMVGAPGNPVAAGNVAGALGGIGGGGASPF